MEQRWNKQIGILGVIVGMVALTLPSEASAYHFVDENYARTNGPIVLVGGLLAFENMLDFETDHDCYGGLIAYWGEIPSQLRDRGATVRCYAPPAVQSSHYRGQQLVAYLEELAIEFPGKRFNLIGHSHGGPTVRFAAHHRPDLVASVTSLDGVNGGSHIAGFLDEVLGGITLNNIDQNSPTQVIGKFVTVLAFEAIGNIIDLIDDPGEWVEQLATGTLENDTLEMAWALSPWGAEEFNNPCPAGMSDWSDGCGIVEAIPSHLDNLNDIWECVQHGNTVQGSVPGDNVEYVAVTNGSPGTPAGRVGNVYPVRYYAWSGGEVMTTEMYDIWFGWPFAGYVKDGIHALPPVIQTFFPYTNGLAGDAWFYYRTSPLDYVTGIAGVTALSDYGNLYSAQVDSDGLVSPCSMHLGDTIRTDYYMNHLQAADMFGDMDWLFNARPSQAVYAGGTRQVRNDIVHNESGCWWCMWHGWHCNTEPLAETDPASLFRMHANRLREAGM